MGKMSTVDPIKAYDEIAKWERIWIEVVALAWKDPSFKSQLLADGGKHARQVILSKFNFQLAEDVQLNVVEAGKDSHWDSKELIWKHPRAVSTLTLTLPKTPKLDDQAVALSHYFASGQSMPFTCCC
jgi:ribosomally synthesized peptide (two-chain TOMM family)